MLLRMRTLLGAVVLILAGACLLEDKQVGEAEPDDEALTPCPVLCERASDCLVEDEEQCARRCADDTLDAACRDALLSVLTCLDATPCDNVDLPSHPCHDALQARDEACDG